MQKQKSFDKQTTKGKLYLVPTPIGNLEDMSIRCLNILKEATVIASEDTRNTQKLLNHLRLQHHKLVYTNIITKSEFLN